MCAYTLLLYTLTLIYTVVMSAAGLPLPTDQELGSDILAGRDFLSLFMPYEDSPITEGALRTTRNVAEEPTSEGVVVGVRVSSSVARKDEPSTETADQSYLASENLPSILKSQPQPPLMDTYPNFRQTVIYHNPSHARSVSYSTVIQDVPYEKHERKERHYEGTAYGNQFPASEKPRNSTERSWEKPAYVPTIYARPEQNYEVDESASVLSNGRVHGVQAKQTKTKDDNQKVGYVVEGRNYRKYRVEERTPDGFIVGEYGVVSHDDGSLRGVRYMADGTTSPRLIYDALMKFLSL